jgi:hypothetical protein
VLAASCSPRSPDRTVTERSATFGCSDRIEANAARRGLLGDRTRRQQASPATSPPTASEVDSASRDVDPSREASSVARLLVELDDSIGAGRSWESALVEDRDQGRAAAVVIAESAHVVGERVLAVGAGGCSFCPAEDAGGACVRGSAGGLELGVGKS